MSQGAFSWVNTASTPDIPQSALGIDGGDPPCRDVALHEDRRGEALRCVFGGVPGVPVTVAGPSTRVVAAPIGDPAPTPIWPTEVSVIG